LQLSDALATISLAIAKAPINLIDLHLFSIKY